MHKFSGHGKVETIMVPIWIQRERTNILAKNGFAARIARVLQEESNPPQPPACCATKTSFLEINLWICVQG